MKSLPSSSGSTPETPILVYDLFHDSRVNVLPLISRIITLLLGSVKRYDAFYENLQKMQLKASKNATPKMFYTRWVERHDVALTFIQLKPSFEATPEDISR